jgi:hypothetical protein
MGKTTVEIKGHLPDELVQEFMQYIRDYDTKYDEGHESKVHFELNIFASDMSVERLRDIFASLKPPMPYYREWKNNEEPV